MTLAQRNWKKRNVKRYKPSRFRIKRKYDNWKFHRKYKQGKAVEGVDFY